MTSQNMASPTATNSLKGPVQRRSPTFSRAPLRKETLHSVEAWEAKREIIGELYMDQNKPLRVVSRILETEHDFIASPKQFKIRFKHWGFWKNLSTQHANSLLQLKDSRASLGKPSTFLRSGQKLEQIRIEQTIRRSKARAPAKHELKHKSSDATFAGPSLPGGPGRPLPIGIECRTPSPEPQPSHSKEPVVDGCGTFEPGLHALPSIGLSTQGFYSFDAAVDLQNNQETYPHKLKTCDIAIRKLWRVHSSWESDTPPLSAQPAGLQAFRRRNTLLAVLEPAISDKDRLCTTYLQVYTGAFLDCPELASFSRQFIIPLLRHDGMNGEVGALAREADNFIQTGIDSLNLSAHTRAFIENAGTLDQSQILVGEGFPVQSENDIDPALLDGSPGIEMPDLAFEPFDFDGSEGQWVESNGPSPAETPFSVSDLETPPSTLFDGTKSATEASVLDVCMAPVREQADNLESELVSQLNLSVSSYYSGDSAAAITGLGNVATSGDVNTTRAKVLRRLAWFCLFYIRRQEGTSEEARDCLVEAVRGSTYFRSDRGEEWHEVSHLFL